MSDRTEPEAMHPDDVDDLLGAYALDALDPDERERVERHLTTSPAARAEVDRLTGAIDRVADADEGGPDASVPPLDLWDRIAEQLPPHPERVPASWTAATEKPAAVQEPAAVDELARRRARRVPRPARILAAVAAVLLVAAIGVTLVRRTSTAPATLADQLQHQADRAATEPGAHTATLTGSDPSVSIRVVIDANGHGYVEPTGLPALGSDQTYQLWSVDGGTPVSLGLLGADPSVAVVGTGASPRQLAVTAEPAGGSTAPTSNPVASGTVA
jgi:anti-sigma-K factor RskA